MPILGNLYTSGGRNAPRGTAEKPEAGTLETAPPGDDPAPTRRRYQRRDATGTPE